MIAKTFHFQVLGEISLFYSIPSKVTVKAATYVELQVTYVAMTVLFHLIKVDKLIVFLV